jgi:hypothetical protein
MAQADQTVQNATFPTVRADINNNLAALFTDSSGATAPSVTVAFQDWIDTSGTDPVWKKRNAANNAWITLGTITGSAIAFEGTLPSQSGNSGEYLKTNGTVATWEPVVSGINAADVFASSGNWTCPAGVQKVLVTVVGGGGGGQGNRRQDDFSTAGNIGGAGGYGAGILAVTPGTTYAVTVGAGGVGTAGSISGVAATATAGGTSTFETISATGGNGGGGAAGAVTAKGSCSSANATLRRSDVIAAIPLLVGSASVVRGPAAGTAAEAWAVTSEFSPGSFGFGGTYSTSALNAGSGGVGGAVLLLY